MSHQTFGPGIVIANKYRLQRQIGEGAMGVVWAATNETTGREVALKLITRPEPEFRHRLQREARAAGALHHRNIIDVYDIGQTENEDPFLVMQLLHGETVSELLVRKRRLDPPEAAAIGRDVAKALACAHAAQIVHRDLKPANIFLHQESADDENFVVKVLDFGVAKNLAVNDGLRTALGGAVGSLLYMSPEQARADSDVDHRADIWSLGVVLFEMLTGYRPFQGETPEILSKILVGEIPSVSRYVRRIDPGMVALVDKCMQRKREDRYQSATEVATTLRAYITDAGRSSSDAGLMASAPPQFVGGMPPQHAPQPSHPALDTATGVGPRSSPQLPEIHSPAAMPIAQNIPQPIVHEAPEPPPMTSVTGSLLDEEAETATLRYTPKMVMAAVLHGRSADASPHRVPAAPPMPPVPRRLDTRPSPHGAPPSAHPATPPITPKAMVHTTQPLPPMPPRPAMQSSNSWPQPSSSSPAQPDMPAAQRSGPWQPVSDAQAQQVAESVASPVVSTQPLNAFPGEPPLQRLQTQTGIGGPQPGQQTQGQPPGSGSGWAQGGTVKMSPDEAKDFRSALPSGPALRSPITMAPEQASQVHTAAREMAPSYHPAMQFDVPEQPLAAPQVLTGSHPAMPLGGERPSAMPIALTQQPEPQPHQTGSLPAIETHGGTTAIKKKNHLAAAIGLGAGVVLAFVILAVVVFRGGDDKPASAEQQTEAATATPTAVPAPPPEPSAPPKEDPPAPSTKAAAESTSTSTASAAAEPPAAAKPPDKDIIRSYPTATPQATQPPRPQVPKPRPCQDPCAGKSGFMLTSCRQKNPPCNK